MSAGVFSTLATFAILGAGASWALFLEALAWLLDRDL